MKAMLIWGYVFLVKYSLKSIYILVHAFIRGENVFQFDETNHPGLATCIVLGENITCRTFICSDTISIYKMTVNNDFP